jgi:hypothetical protein
VALTFVYYEGRVHQSLFIYNSFYRVRLLRVHNTFYSLFKYAEFEILTAVVRMVLSYRLLRLVVNLKSTNVSEEHTHFVLIKE